MSFTIILVLYLSVERIVSTSCLKQNRLNIYCTLYDWNFNILSVRISERKAILTNFIITYQKQKSRCGRNAIASIGPKKKLWIDVAAYHEHFMSFHTIWAARATQNREAKCIDRDWASEIDEERERGDASGRDVEEQNQHFQKHCLKSIDRMIPSEKCHIIILWQMV